MQLRELRDLGACLLIVSSELEELLRLAIEFWSCRIQSSSDI